MILRSPRHIKHRPIPFWRLTAATILVAASAVVWPLWGCQPKPRPLWAPAMAIANLDCEPTVRVRLLRQVRRVEIDSDAALRVGIGSPTVISLTPPITIEWSQISNHLVLQHAGSDRAIAAPEMVIKPADDAFLKIQGREYPGRITVHPRSGGGFDVVNRVALETYLPGVLVHELYRHWNHLTFQVQAIAARSYAIAEMSRMRHRHFDLESTVASQVYGGRTDHQKAVEGQLLTRGIVVVYDGLVVPTYYSSCSGGIGQDGAVVFPNAPDIPPLRGRVHGAWGKACAYYRWGPFQRDRDRLTQRLAAWGEKMGHPIRRLQRIGSVHITDRNKAGRPTEFTIWDVNGSPFRLGPESFRFACNFQSRGGPPLSSNALLRSSHVQATVSGSGVHFTDGQGFGHGVGLDQFGAEALAQEGHTVEDILAFYYPGTHLVKAY